MESIIFTPELLFANENSWNTDEEYKEKFVNNLFGILEFISKNNFCVLWNTNCEKLLWDYPNKAPWRTDKDFCNSSVVAISGFLHNTQNYIETDLDECNISPFISDNHNYTDFISEILKIMHDCLHKSKSFDLCVLDKKNYIISCNCCDNIFTPRNISCKDDFISYEYVLEFLWNKKNIKDSLTFLIDYYCKNNLSQKILYNYSFTKSFLKEVVDCDKIYRNTIIKQLSLKLTLTLDEARGNGSLQEEYVNSQNRIRITNASRVSYSYDNHNIIFTNYYSDSQHDVGLRHT